MLRLPFVAVRLPSLTVTRLLSDSARSLRLEWQGLQGLASLVQSLSTSQVRDIYGGSLTDWSAPIVAAVAERSQVTVLHHNADFDLISKVTRQDTQWVVRKR